VKLKRQITQQRLASNREYGVRPMFKDLKHKLANGISYETRDH
jgi:hypothetical protein